MRKLFGTDGVRGIANQEVTVELSYRLGQAGAYVLTKENHHRPTILIGADTRLSGEMLVAAMTAGICSVGANVILTGILPTPAIAYLTREYGADAGVVISASHNPVAYNGIKFFDRNGYKLPDRLEEEIEVLISEENQSISLPIGTDIGRVIRRQECVYDYIRYVKKQIKGRLDGLKVVLDCANGASYVSAPETLRQLGAEVYIIHNEPDGTNINKKCGSTDMDDLKAYVIQVGADVGLAFDGDADRCLAVDEKGRLVDGDQMMAIIGLFMKEQNRLSKNTIVGTVMSNLGFTLMGRREGIAIKQTKVGDRYVLEHMLQEGYNLGGEQSGHIIFLDENTTGDGLLTALHLLEILQIKEQKLSHLAKVMTVLPQALVNVTVSEMAKQVYSSNTNIKQAVASVEKELAGEGRVLIRPSGTEPVIRVMIEGKNQQAIERQAEHLAELIARELR